MDDDASPPGPGNLSAALTRLLPAIGGIEVVDRLTALSGSDFTSVMLEFGDGGFTDWSQRLVASSKERLLISGLGIDRVADATA